MGGVITNTFVLNQWLTINFLTLVRYWWNMTVQILQQVFNSDIKEGQKQNQSCTTGIPSFHLLVVQLKHLSDFRFVFVGMCAVQCKVHLWGLRENFSSKSNHGIKPKQKNWITSSSLPRLNVCFSHRRYHYSEFCVIYCIRHTSQKENH